jgi:hypothetical protein
MKIRLYNVLAASNSQYKLNSIELYFYALIQTKYLTFVGYCETNINFITDDQIVFKDRNKTRRVEKVKDEVQNLINRGLIFVDGDISDRHNRLVIRFVEFKKDGYEFISKDMWISILDYRYLQVVFIIMKHKGVYEIAKEKWSSILGYGSKNTGSELVDKMERDGFIYRVVGSKFPDENGQVKQRASKWYLGSNNDDIVVVDSEKVKNSGKERSDDEIIETLSYGDVTVGEFKETINESNWGKKENGIDNELDYGDYEIYRICKDENINAAFNKRCANVIGKKKKSEVYDGVFEKWEEQYLREKSEMHN